MNYEGAYGLMFDLTDGFNSSAAAFAAHSLLLCEMPHQSVQGQIH